LNYFKAAVDNIAPTPTLIGIMGGEPLLHPRFKEICACLKRRFPPEKLGLWSTLDRRFKKYAALIADTFGAVLPNDHTHRALFHAPILIDSKRILGPHHIAAVNNCWIQQNWSASVNPRGAYFCEVAAALDMILKTKTAFDIHTPWWRKGPSAYSRQIKTLCSKCGVCLNPTPRKDSDKIDDIDAWWLVKLKNTSPRIKTGQYRLFDGVLFDPNARRLNEFRGDTGYLKKIGKAFGLDLILQPNGYLKPLIQRDAHRRK
jgi:hypothetical protein